MFKNYRGLKKFALGATILVTAMGLSLPAGATLIGDTITITSSANAPLDTWTDTVVVGAGNELTGGVFSTDNHAGPGPILAHLYDGDFYDIGANSITINYAAIAGFLPYAFESIFSDLDWIGIPGSLTGVSIAAGGTGLSASNISGIHAGGFTFQGTVDLVTGANFTLDLTTDHDIPEPAILPLLAVGLLGLMVSMRRRRSA